MWQTIRSNAGIVIVLLVVLVLALVAVSRAGRSKTAHSYTESDSAWVAPSLYYDASEGEERKLLTFGEDLIANTSKYFGPHGIVAPITNGMNCQNCHLNAGRKNWGNNYSMVYSSYPKYRDRSGGMETIYKRVSDCFERSLNGTAPDSNSREYKAIETYIKWVGRNVKKGEKPVGSGIEKLPFLDRAADTIKGKAVYAAQCESCHGPNGEGQFNAEKTGYIYPPLWGQHSYNSGAGLYRLSNFAGYVKNNMPFKLASHGNAKLSTEEAWDVAAYVNSRPRPLRDPGTDWPDISKKPFDHPFGPYADGFSESQHKFGPYKPIIASRQK